VEPKEAISDGDAARLIADTIAMLETEARLFGELPYDRYLIQLHLSHRGRGGLEHMSSTTLLASPTAFHTRDAYLDLLSLVAHEVFHAWSVKRIRPSGLWPYAYERENYTRLLWWFEGGTSYYDWRILRLSGRATLTEYLAHLADEIAYLDHTPGRLVHSLEEASFDAWIKLYRPDENSPNSSVSYYRKGEVVCALLDIEIRHRSGGRASLDEVMRHLWTAYGKPGRPVPEEGMQALFEEVTGVSLGDLFGGWIRGTEDLPYERVLALAGLRLDRTSRADAPPVSLGARLRSEGGRIFVANVQRDAAAQRAGIDPGDELIAIDGRRVESTSLDGLFAGRSPGDSADVVVARDGRLLTRSVALDPPRRDKVKIVPLADATPEQRALCTHWLRETPPAWTSVGAG
jgi:predicted metalloprotease with PDZ domain